jgi:hypothetical protein
MDPLLTEYAALYKRAFADVTSHVRVKEAGRLGRMGNAILDAVGGAPSLNRSMSDDAIEGALASANPTTHKGWREAIDTGSANLDDLKRQVSEAEQHNIFAEEQAKIFRRKELADMDIDADAYDEMVAGGAKKAPAQAAAPQKGTAEAGDAAGPGGSGGHGLRNALLAGTAAAGTGAAGHQYGQMKEREVGTRNRNLAFGAGAAAGIAAPGLMKNVGKSLQGMGGLAGGTRIQPPRPPSPRPPSPTGARTSVQHYAGGMSPQQSMMMRQRGY